MLSSPYIITYHAHELNALNIGPGIETCACWMYSDCGPIVEVYYFYDYMCCFCDSICLTMYRLLSRNRSTQFSRHDASPLYISSIPHRQSRTYRENLVLMLPVIHLRVSQSSFEENEQYLRLTSSNLLPSAYCAILKK